MSSPLLPGPPKSVYSRNNSPPSYRPSSLNPSRQSPSRSERDTAYNGSEGYINDAAASHFDDYSQGGDLQLSAPSTPPPRPAFGARLLSTLSNAQPAAAALSRKSSVLHSRARSLAAYVPKLNASTTSIGSSERGEQRLQAPHKIFGDLFNGESAPIRLGVAATSPTKEREETEFVMEYTPSLTERPASMFKRRDTAEGARGSPQQARKASWFVRKATPLTPTRQVQHDELASLNINLSLFPNGPADPLSPAAFNDLLLNATNLLQRMQTAYREKADFISSMQPELDVQKEEVEEAETRSKHLKMQLQDMALQAQERERTMQELANQLTEEKMRVQELRENAARSVRLVRQSDQEALADEGETPTRWRNKRRSNESASDSGFESDMDSVFSGNTDASTPVSPGPSTTLSSMTSADAEAWALCQPKGSAHRLQRQTSNSTITSKTSSVHMQSGGGHRPGCDGPAWSTVQALRSENRELKMEVEGMKKTLGECIDFLG